LRRNCRDPSAEEEVWRNAPGPAADRSNISGSRGITKRPRASIVGRLLDNSTKKSQTLNRFRNTLNDRVWTDHPARVVAKSVPATTLV
jgi:hypothetical protein